MAEPLRVLLVDDEAPARALLREYLAAHPGVEIAGECANGFEAVKAIAETRPDLVFLDVQMPDMDGFNVLRAVPEPREFHVVFLTAHEHHALRAFDADALDYLLKPVDPERFKHSLERAKRQIQLRLGHKPEPEAPAKPVRRLLVQKNGREMFLDRIKEMQPWFHGDRRIVLKEGRELSWTRRYRTAFRAASSRR